VAAVRDAGEQHNFERLLHPRILELWIGNFDIGLSLARGNALSDALTTAFTAGRSTRSDKIMLYFNQIYGTARVNNVTSTIASAVRGGWKYNRNVSPRMFLTGFNDYEHDRFQNLTIRFVAGGGQGVKAVKSGNIQLDFDAGIDYRRENFLNRLNRNRRSQLRRQPVLPGVQGDVGHPVDARLHQPERHRVLPRQLRHRQQHGPQEMVGLARHCKRSLSQQPGPGPPAQRSLDLHRVPLDLR
jgi:hypothetical protein